MKIYYGKAIYNNKEISAATRVLKRNTLNCKVVWKKIRTDG